MASSGLLPSASFLQFPDLVHRMWMTDIVVTNADNLLVLISSNSRHELEGDGCCILGLIMVRGRLYIASH